MTAHRLSNWLAAAAIVAVFAAIQHIDTMDALREQQTQQASMADAQRQEARLLRRDLAAAELCRETTGSPGFTWTAAQQLVCVPRNALGVVQTAWVTP